MGKKKAVRKIKELSVVGSVSGEPLQQQTPRKRGRPRKIVAQVEEREEEEQTATEAQDVAETEAKKLEGGEESENKEKIGEGFASSPSSKKEEGSSEEKDLSQKQQPRTSRARRKNKPRKSS